MSTPSDNSLRRTLEPIVIISDAFNQASNWRAITEAWKLSRSIDRRLFLAFTIAFIASLVASAIYTSISRNLLFGIAVFAATTSLLYFRCRIADKHPITSSFGRFDQCFGLNYRFRRYLIFREDLLKGGIGLEALAAAHKNLRIEASLLENRTVSMGAGATAIVSIITSILTTVSTQDHMITSGRTFLILFVLVLALYFYFFLKTVIPNTKHRQQELVCFLTWYEQELASLSPKLPH